MMRSLYSGVSGLKNHQTRMDVIGNNIANVNTIGYKTSRVVFQDIYSQNLSAASQGSTNVGGTNPMQIGLGVTLASIDILHTSAATQTTDNPTDLALEGDGFFIIHPPNSLEPDDYAGTPYEVNGETTGLWVDGFMYTRAGNFYVDNAGYLVNSDGYFVMGYALEGKEVELQDENGDPVLDQSGNPVMKTVYEINYEKLSKINMAGRTGIQFDSGGTVWAVEGEEKVAVAQVAIGVFTNASGLEKKGSSLYVATANSGKALATVADTNGAGGIKPGAVEMSNVDLAGEFTDMIVTQRGFQANSRIITVSDTLLEELINLKR